MQIGSQRPEQPKPVNFEPIIRGLKMIFLTGTVPVGPSVKSVSYMQSSIAKEKKG